VVAPTEKEDLLDRILARDKGRFLSIARQYAPAGEAVDLYQQILYRLWKGLDGFEGRSEPMTWAYRIALNTARTYRRDNLRRDRAWRAYAQNVQSGQRGGRGEEEILREFAQSLPDTERTLLSLYLTNLSWREFAELAGIPEPILRVKISRLKSQFEQQYL
jgi:RNA polymerase sigma-70 factor (ECF subfamily)